MDDETFSRRIQNFKATPHKANHSSTEKLNKFVVTLIETLNNKIVFVNKQTENGSFTI